MFEESLQNDRPSTSADSKDCLLCKCIVCDLLTNGFSRRNFKQQRDIYALGRHTPVLNLDTKIKSCTRHFNISFYEKHEWLAGCATYSKLFCWPCLLFTPEKTVWNWSGFTDLNNFHKGSKRHVNSKAHLVAVVKEKTFENYRIEYSSDNHSNHKLHNELVEKNRNILKRLIDVTWFFATHEISFRGYEEGKDSSNKENYTDLLELLISTYDPILKNHINESTVFRNISNKTQNDLIKSLSNVVLKNFKDEIKNSPFISIIIDETTDTTNLSQLSIVVRYVKDEKTAQERFFCFLDITDQSEEAMFKIVCDLVENLECHSKLVAQSYDGGAVMAGHLRDFQAKVKEQYHNAIFVHCFNHRLDLVLSQSVGTIKDCKVFFSTLSGFASFFSKSSKRACALDIQIQKRFLEIASAGWNYNGQLIKTVFQHREALTVLFQDMLNDKDKWDAETVNSARGYLQLLEVDFNFNFLLNVFSGIFHDTDILFDTPQAKENQIGFCIKSINSFEEILVGRRDHFQYFWDKTIDNTEPERKRIKTEHITDCETSYRHLFLEILDNIVEHLRERFHNFSDLKFLELCNFSGYENCPFPEEALNSLKQSYGKLFDFLTLRSQLIALYEIPELNKLKTCSEMLSFLIETGLNKPYSEVVKLCQLVLAIPATSASVKGSSSVLNRIKTFVGNSTYEERVSGLAVLSIEKGYLKYLLQNPSFYEAVIDQFARFDRIELHYK